ncbi:hypothetical protein RND71_014727 [Anisodus tanguticus]|uniref:DUF4378 domain-containing protein n=1 Tax=Anisodus tanguticus TaxID=243964 RepID=A0AAE1VFA7_9SOLA|nr:hypothetical protein RND71_014727 [Anisodus tanguticus]
MIAMGRFREIKKTYDELKFKKEKLLSEITLLSESIKNPTCSSSTEEQKKLFEKLFDTDRLNKFTCFTSLILRKWLRLARHPQLVHHKKRRQRNLSLGKVDNIDPKEGVVGEKKCIERFFGWTSMEELMVDEVVDKDMSTQRGKWTDFSFEAFEEGVDIENGILSSLMDERSMT